MAKTRTRPRPSAVRAAPSKPASGRATRPKTPSRVTARPTSPTNRARTIWQLVTPKAGQPITVLAVSVVVVAAATAIAGRAECGFDATWALVWARDLVHAHSATIPAGAFAATPHPGAIALGVLAGIGGFGHATIIGWTILAELSVIAMFAGVVRLAAVCGSYPAGWIAAIAIAVQPGIRDAVGRGTTDIACAAACAWALALVLRRPKLAIGLIAFAALCRPEAWLLIPTIVIVRWPHTSRSTRLVAVVWGGVIPAVWLGMGAALFHDPLAALHVTVGNDQGSGTGGGIGALAHTFLHLPGLLGFAVLLGVGFATVAVKRRPPLLLPLVATACVLAGLVIETVGGASFVPRYLTTLVTLAVPVAFAALFTGLGPVWARRTAALGVIALAVIAFTSTTSARTGDNNRFAAQHRAVGALFSVLTPQHVARCDGVTIPQTALAPAAVLAFREGTHISIATDSTTTQTCALVPQWIDAVNANGWGPNSARLTRTPYLPNAHLAARDNQWSLYEQ